MDKACHEFDHSLEILSGEELLYSFDGPWLHPIFEFEALAESDGIDTSKLKARDKIVGKAAAMLLVRLGFLQIEGETMSSIARDFLVKEGISFSYGVLVEKTDCESEELLLEVFDTERAYEIIKARIDGP